MHPNPLVQIALTFLMYVTLAIAKALYRVRKKPR